MASGFSIIYLGVDLKISLIYKVPLFALILVLIASYEPRQFLTLVSFILFSFIGPLVQFFDYARADFLLFDFATLVKVYTPIAVVLWLRILVNVDSAFAKTIIEKIIWTSFLLLSVNFVLGALGIGKSTYESSGEDGAGSTGLIIAGNELGGAFLVTFCFVLHKVWNDRKYFQYLLLSLFTVACGFIVSTKTTMLASLLIVLLVPIFNERDRFYSITRLKLYILVPFILLISILVYLVFDILQAIGLYDRIMWFYEKRGLLGILLSGRDEMIADKMDIVVNQSVLFEQIFGQGQAISLKDKLGSAATEVDSFDLFNLYGIFTLILIGTFYLYHLIKSHSLLLTKSFYGPYIFLTSLILFSLSQLSGHIWNSGTVGLLLGCMIGLIYVERSNESYCINR
ncbi:hypothetical protein MHM95_09395 [Pseudoalteromonas sp. CnMc7-15]|uniref:hypothetical protein n=1 Tax=unclassified Pseudoalteromonas TaxID=194690 RepID=UPI001EF5D67E|nr:hypothetical protein [Pseudoalteromonas sp. CnMc7-15]MCG7566504.1 hypothetical protein [Pseudoalteromonas sp. CnMc7-15]